MARFLLLSIMMSVALNSSGQDISVTFTGTGAATRVDSVSATNLRTSLSVSLPGDATLLLTGNSGVPDLPGPASLSLVYPNPFSGQATFTTTVQESQEVSLTVQSLMGQTVAETHAFTHSGENSFAISLAAAGIYLVSLTTAQGTASYKVICTETKTPENSIQYLGSGSNHHNNHNNQNNQNNHNNHNNHNNPNNPLSSPDLKISQSIYLLEFKPGDVILYRCMSGIYATIVTDSPAASRNYEIEFTPCTDPDGKNYPAVTIGEQTWMAENLAYLPEVSPPTVGYHADPYYYVYGNEGISVTDARSAEEFSTYGVLYSWPAAMNGGASSESVPSGVQGICPTGWHLPSNEEWIQLSDYLGNSAGGKMKDTGTMHWTGSNSEATNESGFTGLPGGFRHHNGSFAEIGYLSFFWTSTESFPGKAAYYTGLFADNGDVYFDDIQMERGFYVRCVKNESGALTLPTVTTSAPTRVTTDSIVAGGIVKDEGNSPVTARGICLSTAENPTVNDLKTLDGNGACTFKSSMGGLTPNTTWFMRAYATNSVGTAYGDQLEVVVPESGGHGIFFDIRDGHKYPYVIIGTQTWFAENLAYLPAVSPPALPIGNSLLEKFYYVNGYDGDVVSAAKATSNYATYGVLYSWEAARTSCPAGWHNPDDEEWKTLEKFLGMTAISADSLVPTGYRRSGRVGGQLKEAGTSHWRSPNVGATNSSGFTALPGGIRFTDGTFAPTSPGWTGYFWTSTRTDPVLLKGLMRGMYDWSDGIGRYDEVMSYGVAVRCVRNP